MEVTQAIHNWRSIRKYKHDPIPAPVLRAVLEAGRRAPSWSNIQPWHFLVIDDQAMKDKLVKLARGQKNIAEAPVVIAVCGDLTAWDKPKYRQSLYELMTVKAIPVTAEIIDKILVDDPLLAIADRGPAMVLARTFEQLGIAYGFMALEAVNQGLGMCIIGAIGNEVTAIQEELYATIKAELRIPTGIYLLTLLTLGFPDEAPPARPRKVFAEVVSWGTFGQPLPE